MLFKWRWSRATVVDDGWKHTMAPLCWWVIPLPTSRVIPNTAIKSRMWLSVSKLVVWFVWQRSRFEVAVAAFTTSEWKLARQLYATLQPGDVVVADSAYGTYVDLALVHSANADAVFRKHHARHCDFRRGKKLGIGDHIVQWQRPKRCPQSMPPEDFEHYQQASKEVHLLIQRPGFDPPKSFWSPL